MQGILPDNELKNYILAQLHVMKSFTSGQIHALIEPHILHGYKAWKRYKFWRYKFNYMMRKEKVHVEIKASEMQIKNELNKTKEFLEDKEFEEEKMFEWVKCKKVSPYFIILSSNIDESNFPIDLDFYRNSITPGIEEYFRKLFPK
jgi:hypothetical protein